MDDVLAIMLGGGQGSRLFPLTHQRSKPAVPIGGKYRLIDVPISNCLHADLRRIFVLTQFNSASLNHHVAQTYRMDPFSHGFVDIIAAEQTPDSSNWFQGTADAVRQAARHFRRYDADYYLILAGDQLYRMDYGRLLDAHVDRRRRHHGRRAAGDAARRAGDGHLSVRSRRTDRRLRGKAEQRAARGDRQQRASGDAVPQSDATTAPKPFVASMGIYVFSREVLLELLQNTTVTDFGREIIPAALTTHRVRAYLHDGYWADVGTVESFYDANIMLTEPHAPFKFYDPRRPIYTHERFLPPSHMRSCTVRESIVAEGCFLDECSIEQSVIGIRTHISQGTRITRSVLLGADMYASEAPGQLGIGRDVVLDRVIIDKNASIGDGARLLNEAGVQHADGDGYYIRGGIIIVPEGRPDCARDCRLTGESGG